MGKIVRLSSDWKEDIKTYLNENKNKEAGLSIFDTISGMCMEVECNYSDILDVIQYISNIELARPEEIGYNELTNSIVVNVPFTNGKLESLRVYKWDKAKGLIDITSSIFTDDAIEDIKGILDNFIG